MNKSHNASPRDPLAPVSPLTWDQMVAIEPGLAELERRAAERPTRPSHWQVYAAIKEELNQLVGWRSRDPRLRDGWDIAMDRIKLALLASPPRTPRRTARAKGQGG